MESKVRSVFESKLYAYIIASTLISLHHSSNLSGFLDKVVARQYLELSKRLAKFCCCNFLGLLKSLYAGSSTQEIPPSDWLESNTQACEELLFWKLLHLE